MKQAKKAIHMILVTLVTVLISSSIVLATSGHYTSTQVPGSWVLSGDDYYWKKNSGGNLTNAFLDYKNNTYYLNQNGIMAKGWAQVDGKWYYFRNWGGMYKNTFLEYDNNTYFLDANGVMAVGWKQINGNWYYFRDWGGMYKDKLFSYDNNNYYVNADGVMVTGWKKVSGSWYYFRSWGGAQKGWAQLSYPGQYKNAKYWNYFKSDGKYVTDSDQKGCGHGYATIRDLKLKSGMPFIYYCLINDSTVQNKVDQAAGNWGNTYFKKASSLNQQANADLTISFGNLSGLDANTRAVTYFIVGSSTYGADNLTGNYDKATIILESKNSSLEVSTIIHEMGHALGLSHRISSKNAIMHYLASTRTVTNVQTSDRTNCRHING